MSKPSDDRDREPEKKRDHKPERSDSPESTEDVVPVPVEDEPKDKRAGLATLATQTVKAFAFPLLLAVLVGLYCLVQHWLDRKDPKLSMAPVHAKHDLARFK